MTTMMTMMARMIQDDMRILMTKRSLKGGQMNMTTMMTMVTSTMMTTRTYDDPRLPMNREVKMESEQHKFSVIAIQNIHQYQAKGLPLMSKISLSCKKDNEVRFLLQDH